MSDPSCNFERRYKEVDVDTNLCSNKPERSHPAAFPEGLAGRPAGRSAGKRLARPGSQSMGGTVMNSVVQVHPDRPRCRVAPSALAMLASARQGLAGAEDEGSAGGRYVAAHLAALREAAAVVAARAEPAPSARRKRPQSVWELLPRVEPALPGSRVPSLGRTT